MEICSTASEYGQYNEIYQNLMTADMQEIVDITGCKKPCTYNEYKFTSSTPDEDPRSTIPSDQVYIAFWAVSRTTQVEKEVLLYPFKGTCQKLLSGFFPLRGGGWHPPIPLSFFGQNDFPLGGTPHSARGKIR